MTGDNEHPPGANVPGQAVKGQLRVLTADPQLAEIATMAALVGHGRLGRLQSWDGNGNLGYLRLGVSLGPRRKNGKTSSPGFDHGKAPIFLNKII